MQMLEYILGKGRQIFHFFVICEISSFFAKLFIFYKQVLTCELQYLCQVSCKRCLFVYMFLDIDKQKYPIFSRHS